MQDIIYLPGRDKDVLNRINNAAAFILSSDYEGMPNALIEAMCMGMPVISTDCPSGGPQELIKSGENGILISVGNKENLVNAMKLMTNACEAEKLAGKAGELRKRLTDAGVFEEWRKYLFCE